MLHFDRAARFFFFISKSWRPRGKHFLVLWDKGIFLMWTLIGRSPAFFFFFGVWTHNLERLDFLAMGAVHKHLCVWCVCGGRKEREQGWVLWIYRSTVKTCCYSRPLINWWTWVVETPGLVKPDPCLILWCGHMCIRSHSSAIKCTICVSAQVCSSRDITMVIMWNASPNPFKMWEMWVCPLFWVCMCVCLCKRERGVGGLRFSSP